MVEAGLGLSPLDLGCYGRGNQVAKAVDLELLAHFAILEVLDHGSLHGPGGFPLGPFLLSVTTWIGFRGVTAFDLSRHRQVLWHVRRFPGGRFRDFLRLSSSRRDRSCTKILAGVDASPPNLGRPLGPLATSDFGQRLCLNRDAEQEGYCQYATSFMGQLIHFEYPEFTQKSDRIVCRNDRLLMSRNRGVPGGSWDGTRNSTSNVKFRIGGEYVIEQHFIRPIV